MKKAKAEVKKPASPAEEREADGMVIGPETLRWSGRIEIHHPMNGHHAAIISGEGDDDEWIRSSLRQELLGILEVMDIDDEEEEEKNKREGDELFSEPSPTLSIV